MKLNEVKTFVVETIKQAFINKKTLDKFTEDENGKLLYNGSEISSEGSVNISDREGNALELEEDGSLFVSSCTCTPEEITEEEMQTAVNEAVTEINNTTTVSEE